MCNGVIIGAHAHYIDASLHSFSFRLHSVYIYYRVKLSNRNTEKLSHRGVLLRGVTLCVSVEHVEGYSATPALTTSALSLTNTSTLT